MNTTGVIVGKFFPFHKGHAYMISQALEHCDELFVFACTRNEQYLAGETRVEWIRSVFPVDVYPQVHVGIIDQDAENLPDRGPKEWAEVTRKKLGGRAPDMVFTSEEYGHNWAKELGCQHILVDAARDAVPISGTEIREHPLDNLKFLHPLGRAYYCARIALVGDDVSRKEKVSEKLMQLYGALRVPDLREKQDEATTALQAELEDWTAQLTGPLLICETPTWDYQAVTELDASSLARYSGYIVCGSLTAEQQAHVLGEPHLMEAEDMNLKNFVDTILTRANGDKMPKVGK